MSCLIFVIAAEILSTKFRSSTQVTGVKINKKYVKIAQLADDTTLFLKRGELPTALKIVEKLGSVLGLKLNKDKTEGIYLGCNTKKCKQYAGIKWVDQAKSLGFIFGTNTKVTYHLNWKDKICSIDKLIKNWKKRKLTLIGKSVVIQNFVIPKITYIASVQPISEIQIKEVEN